MPVTIKLKRGAEANLPALDAGEPAFCLDSGRMFVGDGFSNVPIGDARVGAGSYGAITVSPDGSTWTINNGYITAAMLANMTTQRLIGRNTAGAGVPEEVTIAQILDWTGNTEGALLYRGDSAWTNLAPGNAGDVLQQYDLAGDVRPVWTRRGWTQIIDEKSSGVSGGTFNNGAWRTRDLNTIFQTRGGGVSLASNQFTLEAGIWRIEASAPATYVNGHMIALVGMTLGALQLGTSAYAGNAVNVTTRSELAREITLTAPEAFEIQHKCELSQATFGFGAAMNVSTTEKYTIVEIHRLG